MVETIEASRGVYALNGPFYAPPNILKLVERVAARLAQRGYTLRTDGLTDLAHAAATAALDVGGRVQFYLPSRRHEALLDDALRHHPNASIIIAPQSAAAMSVDQHRHLKQDPQTRRLQPHLEKFIQRNRALLEGEGTDHVHFALIWSSDEVEHYEQVAHRNDALALFIKQAESSGRPVFNLARKDALQRLANFLAQHEIPTQRTSKEVVAPDDKHPEKTAYAQGPSRQYTQMYENFAQPTQKEIPQQKDASVHRRTPTKDIPSLDQNPVNKVLQNKTSSDFNWYRLSSVEGVQPEHLWRVCDLVKSKSMTLSSLIEQPESDLVAQVEYSTKRVLSSLGKQNPTRIFDEFQRLQRSGVHIIHPENEVFSKINLAQARRFGLPPILFAKGNLALIEAPSVAIVGSRNAGEEGLQIARKLAADLAKNRLNIVSGYARGIDTCAHLGALEVGGTTTIALSMGLSHFVQKKEFRGLFNQSNTLVLSQFHPTQQWTARNAMARNKLVCLLSQALIVISSGKEVDAQGRMSGTFQAAKSALAMSVAVFVVSPSSFTIPPQGNLDLIKSGGREITPDTAVNAVLDVIRQRPAPTNTKTRLL